MNVLYAMIYAPEKGGSGAPIYTHNLMKGMIERGDRAGIVFSVHHSYTPSKNLPYKYHPLFFEHPPIFDNQPKATGSIPFKRMTQKQVFEYVASFYRAFENLTQRKKYDLLHVQHGMYIGYAAALIKEKYHIPFFVSLHAMELNFLEEFPDPIFAMKAMIDADRILALSDSQKQRLLDEYTKDRIIALDMKHKKCSHIESELKYLSMIGNRELKPSQIGIFPLGIDIDHYNIREYEYPKELQELASGENPKIVMYAGRLIEMKGIKNLLKAEKLYNQKGDVMTVVIGGGELENYVKEIAAKRKNVHYLGFKEQKEMPLYLNFVAEHRGVFTVPSSSEGMSLVYLEAMACGSRVLASCKKDMAEMDFMQRPYARFTEFGDIQELADTITRMFQEKPLARSVIRRHMQKYNLDNFRGNVYELYERFIEKKKNILRDTTIINSFFYGR